MKKTVKFVEPVFRFAAVSYLTSCLLLGNTNPPKDDDDNDDAVYDLTPFEISTGGGGYAPASTIAGTRLSSAQMGATAGGAQDINLARMEVLQGNIPRPDTFTPEGLFSEHDLPIQVEARPGQLLSIGGEAMRASILGVPRARVLAQIGFASGLDARTWQRQPLNLVAVVDKSGSMSGQPLELVKQSLREVVQQLGENDQLSIVLYGDHAHVSMPPTILSKENRKQVLSEIASIVSNGSTAMEHGLQVGYQVAEHSSRTFEGTTRLMLFTDEQPNVGNTAASGFMGQMREGSKKGFGLTTIGVGVHFGAELANKISAVRGGNLFYFPDYMTMVNTFEEDFDTMVTELAYDMMVTIKPEHDWKIEAVYGIPANMIKWLPDDSLRFRVETLFLSKRKGAIYFALAPKRSES
ncbi:MAG: VWA domain-containing protein, partial [Verrucomicrobiae bacterium]|nr:VWA domain-containing protein [Verrucomicrobiae bacterium]